MSNAKKRLLILILFVALIIGGIYLLADSPVGEAFMKGFNEGYENGLNAGKGD